MSVVVPAYNEEDRLSGMLEEAVNYLEQMYGTLGEENGATAPIETRSMRKRKPNADGGAGHATGSASDRGWEIIIVSDGSTDRTEKVAFGFARDHQLSLHPKGEAGPWTPKVHEGVHIPPGTIRVVNLTHNRGKGGAVTHGMRHVRGRYVVFADADGASKFEDLGKLVVACQDLEDADGRAVAVGSRAHMVGSEAVVKVRPYPAIVLDIFRCSWLILSLALQIAQLPHAFVPSDPVADDAAQDGDGQGHAVRVQAVLARGTPLDRALHALRRLDLRRGNADAGRVRAHPRGRSPRRLARSQGK